MITEHHASITDNFTVRIYASDLIFRNSADAPVNCRKQFPDTRSKAGQVARFSPGLSFWDCVQEGAWNIRKI